MLAVLPLLLVGVFLSLCLGCAVHVPCTLPYRLNEEDLFGEWELTYDYTYWVSDPIEGSLVVTGTTAYLVRPATDPMPLTRCNWLVGFRGQLSGEDFAWERCPQLRSEDHSMEGIETVHLREDGTYQHTFRSTDYSYESPKQQWEFISTDDAPDGPKVRMEGMKYFAEGVAQANSTARIVLKPQTADLLRIQEYVESTEPRPEGVGGGVVYPDFGYVFLYPRVCQGELSLVQMGFRVGDPDNPVIRSPIFRRK